MKFLKTSKIVGLVAAGKLACGTEIEAGKGAGGIPDSSLTIDETSFVSDSLILPSGSVEGTLCSETANGTRVDFLVNGIRNDTEMHVFLAMSTTLNPSSWPSSRAGQLELDPNTLEIMAAIKLPPEQRYLQKPENISIGKAVLGSHLPFPISFFWSDMSSSKLFGDKFYVQALAIPIVEGSLIWPESQASEVDAFIIQRTGGCGSDGGGKGGGEGGGGGGSGGGK